MPLPVYYVCFVLVLRDVSSQLPAPATGALSLFYWTLTPLESEAQIFFFLLQGALLMVFLP